MNTTIRDSKELVFQLEGSLDKLLKLVQANQLEKAKAEVLQLSMSVNVLRQSPLGELVDVGLAQRAAAVVSRFSKVRDSLGMQHTPLRRREVAGQPSTRRYNMRLV